MYERNPELSVVYRDQFHAPSCPTDLQAEVLIPGRISLDSLLGVVVRIEETRGRVGRVLEAGGISVPVITQPLLFTSETMVSEIWNGRVIELTGI